MKLYKESSAKERFAFWLIVAGSLLPLVPYALNP